MSVFSSIMARIFNAAETVIHPGASPAAETTSAATPAASEAAPASSAPAAASSQPMIDVEAVLTAMAAGKGGGGNWKSSIVDLLKLLDLDSSLSARKELAGELNVHAGADGSAEENIALHKAVMQKLAENGGKVPDSLKS